ncbi:GNAT family N-acetyltransferase [Longispora albida]|uniref:GNAT family N-acetyltransferase n=1 Tax=Longispora albida TaxID=203523 RepID=UPI0004780518|nr:GNAT family N-acetyltransferase [Longispora albida]
MLEPVEIVAGRLQLRPPQAAEAREAYQMLIDPDVQMWNPVEDIASEADAAAWLDRTGDWGTTGKANFTIFDTAGTYLGNIALRGMHAFHGTATIGYRIAPWARGQGVATDALVAVSRWGFGALDLHRIELRHAVPNAGSCRVAEKAGYVCEGVLRQGYRTPDGKRHDEHLHALVRADQGTP